MNKNKIKLNVVNIKKMFNYYINEKNKKEQKEEEERKEKLVLDKSKRKSKTKI